MKWRSSPLTQGHLRDWCGTDAGSTFSQVTPQMNGVILVLLLSFCILWLLCQAFLGLGAFVPASFTATVASAVATHHQPAQQPAPTCPQSFPTYKSLSRSSCVLQSPCSLVRFPAKIVSRGRLVTCKIEALWCLGRGLGHGAFWPHSLSLRWALELL